MIVGALSCQHIILKKPDRGAVSLSLGSYKCNCAVSNIICFGLLYTGMCAYGLSFQAETKEILETRHRGAV